MDLANKKCVPCEGGTAPLDDSAVKIYAAEFPSWQVVENKKIRKDFQFKDFLEAMQFVNKVADIAEAEQHHPDISIFYNKVSLELSTHAIGGLSENDFILAAKVDRLSMKDIIN